MSFQQTLLILAAALALPAVPVAAASADADGERMICKLQKKTGTRFPRKICRTAAQWEQMAEENKRAAAEQINRPMIEIRRGN